MQKNKYTPISEWRPACGITLEPNALTVVKSNSNYLVVAGPGAGKTELLAQRACYLLETNTCPHPRKILAISFKRDAAHNLKLRVRKRVGDDLAYRFTSMTFDSFAKSLVDRFLAGLPEDYRPNPGYEILTEKNPQAIQDAFKNALVALGQITQKEKLDLSGRYSMPSLTSLPFPVTDPELEAQRLVLSELFLAKPTSKVTFPIITRLAQYLLLSNPKICNYLQQTYGYVFLDEFQDTTALQFDLLKTAFHGSNSVLTAVGDQKQRIMLWAGAMKGIFKSYVRDFSASDNSLVMNFRSAPRLVDLQNHLARTLLQSNVTVQPSSDKPAGSGIAEFWVFADEAQEASALATSVAKEITTGGKSPRDFCFLFKQQASDYAVPLMKALSRQGISARVENDLQDLLVEPMILYMRNFMHAILDSNSHQSITALLVEVAKLEAIDDDSALLKREILLRRSLKSAREKIVGGIPWSDILDVLRAEIKRHGYKKFKAVYEQYSQKYFNELLLKFVTLLAECYQVHQDLGKALAELEGEGAIPIMTIHKSKGLEFDTVFFIGFDDQNFWSYKKQPDEDTCAFFVALSRAKNEVYFTFSETRTNPKYGLESRNVNDIRPILDSLSGSNVITYRDHRPPKK